MRDFTRQLVVAVLHLCLLQVVVIVFCCCYSTLRHLLPAAGATGHSAPSRLSLFTRRGVIHANVVATTNNNNNANSILAAITCTYVYFEGRQTDDNFRVMYNNSQYLYNKNNYIWLSQQPNYNKQ